ncbi:uncharacterized protein LOC34618053 [Cyclospora cayetanensis]|uniref:Uncharacterized protein LOC34618053 n=1 Tax=Cyclospora cayetanensis TaxID=88456 RepID=A0A6P6RUS9_9EIME|nr:uncharacterized protein LOC34618053 [Cyclospora cayetanensis]
MRAPPIQTQSGSHLGNSQSPQNLHSAIGSSALGDSSMSHLLRLPRWLLLPIARFLPARDLLQLEGSCRYLKEISSTWDGLWRHKVITDFVRRYESLQGALDLMGSSCSCHITGGGCSLIPPKPTVEKFCSSEDRSISPTPSLNVFDSGKGLVSWTREGPQWPQEGGDASVRRSTAYTLTVHPFTWRVLYFRVCMLLKNLRGGLAHRRILKEALKPPIHVAVEGGMCITLDCRRLLWCNGEALQCFDLDRGRLLWSSWVAEEPFEPTSTAAFTAGAAEAAAGAQLTPRRLLNSIQQEEIPATGVNGSQMRFRGGPPKVAPFNPLLTGPVGASQGWRSRCHVVASASHAFTFVRGWLQVFCLQTGLYVRDLCVGLSPIQTAAAASCMPIDVCHRSNQFAFISKIGAIIYDSETLAPLFALQHVGTLELRQLQQQQQQQRRAYLGGEWVGGPPPHAEGGFDFCWAGAACRGRPLHRRTECSLEQQQLQHQQGDATRQSGATSNSDLCSCFCHLNGAERNASACNARGCWASWNTNRGSCGSSGGLFASRRCRDTELQCSLKCCRLGCRHIVTWHAGVSRRLLVWSASPVCTADASQGPPSSVAQSPPYLATPSASFSARSGVIEAPAIVSTATASCARLVYTLRGHTRPLLRVRQQTDWRDMHEYFLASLDVGGTVRVWHSAAFPQKEATAAAAAAAMTRACERDTEIAAAPLLPDPLQQQGGQMNAAGMRPIHPESAGISSRRRFLCARQAEDDSKEAAIGCIAVIPPMDSYWVHRISLSCHGLLTLCRRKQVLQHSQQHQQPLLLLWMLNAPSLSSLRARRGTKQKLRLDWSSTNPDAVWQHMLSRWKQLAKGTTKDDFGCKVVGVLEDRRRNFSGADTAIRISVKAAAESHAVPDSAAVFFASASEAARSADTAAAAASRRPPPSSGAPTPEAPCVVTAGRTAGFAIRGLSLRPLSNRGTGSSRRSSSDGPRSLGSQTTGICSRSSSVQEPEESSHRSLASKGGNGSTDKGSKRTIRIPQSCAEGFAGSMPLPRRAIGGSGRNSGPESTSSQVHTLEICGAYLLPSNAFFAEFSGEGLISVLCGEDEVNSTESVSGFAPRVPRYNPFKRSLSDWLVFDVERLQREHNSRAASSSARAAAAADSVAEVADEGATADAAAALCDDAAFALRQAKRCCWRGDPGVRPQESSPDRPLQAFYEPAATQWRLQQQQRAAEEAKRRESIKSHRRLVLQWIERQRRRRHRSAVLAASAAAHAASHAEAAVFATNLTGEGHGHAENQRTAAASAPLRPLAISPGPQGASSTPSVSNSRTAAATNENRAEVSAVPTSQRSLRSPWPASVEPQALDPLSSVAWLREKGNAWALVDWKAVQVDANGSLVILDFAHPDASPLCPAIFL